MAEHDRVKDDLCTVCGSPNPSNMNVEATGVNLCGSCAVEYMEWRPRYAPVEPDVLWFVRWKRGYPC